ncbi:hypothetical protein KKD81_01575 [Patescibacteria group bacterium]|nr:hypothetical protein [Patescibacteria group bacterium]
MPNLALVEDTPEKRLISRAHLPSPTFKEGDGVMALRALTTEVRLSPAFLHWYGREDNSSPFLAMPVNVKALPLCDDGPLQGPELCARAEKACMKAGETSLTDKMPDLFARLLLHDAEQPDVILRDNGQPNILLIENGARAITLVFVGHCLHVTPFWDVDLVKVDGRGSRWAGARVVTITGGRLP